MEASTALGSCYIDPGPQTGTIAKGSKAFSRQSWLCYIRPAPPVAWSARVSCITKIAIDSILFPGEVLELMANVYGTGDRGMRKIWIGKKKASLEAIW